MIIYRQKQYSLVGTRIVAGVNKNILGKGAIEANRSALKTEKKVLNGVNKVKQEVESIALNPGSKVKNLARNYVDKPVTSLSTDGVSLATGLPVDMIPLPTKGLESAIKRKFPKYDKITNSASKWYDKNLGGYVENGTNTIINSMKWL